MTWVHRISLQVWFIKTKCLLTVNLVSAATKCSLKLCLNIKISSNHFRLIIFFPYLSPFLSHTLCTYWKRIYNPFHFLHVLLEYKLRKPEAVIHLYVNSSSFCQHSQALQSSSKITHNSVEGSTLTSFTSKSLKNVGEQSKFSFLMTITLVLQADQKLLSVK